MKTIPKKLYNSSHTKISEKLFSECPLCLSTAGMSKTMKIRDIYVHDVDLRKNFRCKIKIRERQALPSWRISIPIAK